MANLGDHFTPTPPDAKEEILRLMLVEGLSANRALGRLGMSWQTLHGWRGADPDWEKRYRAAQETLADAHADEAGEALALELPPVTDKSAMAHVSLARERSGYHRWRASVQAPGRYGDAGKGQQSVTQQVVVMLPQRDPTPALAPLPASVSAEIPYPYVHPPLASAVQPALAQPPATAVPTRRDG